MPIRKKKNIKNGHVYKEANKSENMNYLEKQMILELHMRIKLYIDSYLVLTEKGSPAQIAMAQQKAREEFFRLAAEMQKLASSINEKIQLRVFDFLGSVQEILHCRDLLTEGKIIQCLKASQYLESSLRSP